MTSNLIHRSEPDSSPSSAIQTRDLQSIEALLFLANEPMSLKQLSESTQLPKATVESALNQINERYKATGSAFEAREVTDGVFQLQLNEDFANFFAKQQQRIKKTMPKGVLETLAIIAYKQPITRMEIEAIRGVGSDHPIKALLTEGFVEAQGKKQVAGLPNLYGTTEKFLRRFNLSALENLPPLSEVKAYDFLGGATKTA